MISGLTGQSNNRPSHPTPEYVFQSRVQAVTAPVDKERQRTLQACNKCRERKTKCSGDRPVCQRCTARGLICTYSNREPRTRGPSKPRLRNAVSSTELRATAPHNTLTPQNGQHAWQSQTPSSLPRHYRNLSANYGNGIQRTPSLPTSRYDQFNSGIRPSQFSDFSSMESWHEPYPPSNLMNTQGNTPACLNFAQASPNSPSTLYHHMLQATPLRDMRRVQSHSSLIGKHRPDLQTVIDPALRKSTPLLNQQNIGFDHSFYAPYEGMSPVSPFYYLPQAMQNGHSPYIEHLSHVHSDTQLNWGYHSDGGSTGSDNMDNTLVSSPSTSSEGVPDAQSGAASPESFNFLTNNTSSPGPVYSNVCRPQNMPGDVYRGLPNQNEAMFSTPPPGPQVYHGLHPC